MRYLRTVHHVITLLFFLLEEILMVSHKIGLYHVASRDFGVQSLRIRLVSNFDVLLIVFSFSTSTLIEFFS